MRIFRKFVYLLILLCFTTILAQATDCSAIVKQAMAAVQTSCAATGRNQACYGYVSLQATPRDGIPNFTFAKAGDLANVADLASLQLNALDSVNKTWGIVLMKLQANLPDTLPGENVTFLMFGNVQIQNAVPSGAAGQATAEATAQANAPATPFQPMQAFYFKTGIGQTTCAGAPADGLLIQTPKGAGQISLRANNVDIQLGSTAYLQAQPGSNMSVKVVEGKGHLTAGGKTVVIPAGSQVNIPIDEDLNASGEPSDPEPYDASELGDLPVGYLPDEIDVAPPADEATIHEAETEAAQLQSADDHTGTDLNSDNSQSPDHNPPTDTGSDHSGNSGSDDSGG